MKYHDHLSRIRPLDLFRFRNYFLKLMNLRGPFAKLSLLLRVGTLWRCGDGLFFEVPPLASDELLTTLHQLLENGVTVVLKETFLG
jgi:hypothetical protein